MRAAEIAELMGLTLANVEQILSRSLRRMRGQLEAEPAASELPGPQADRAALAARRPPGDLAPST